MNDALANIKTNQHVVAASRDGDTFRAAELRLQEGNVEVLWVRTSQGETADWVSFAAECGLATSKGKPVHARRPVIIGYETTGVAFYGLDVPAAGKEETDAIVRMQAQAVLPLDPERMELVWRRAEGASGSGAGSTVTVAAARSDSLLDFMETVRPLEPTAILLTCEAVVCAWRRLFGGGTGRAVVVDLGRRQAEVCLVQGGALQHAVVLGTGRDDLVEEAANPTSVRLELMRERFAQDMRSVLESFDPTQAAELPVVVLSDGSKAIGEIVSSLCSAGMKARAAAPEAAGLKVQCPWAPGDAYAYHVPIGLALLAVDKPVDVLDLFEGLQSKLAGQEATTRRFLPRIAAAVAVLMFLGWVVTAYSVDVAMEKRLKEVQSDPNFALAQQRQKVLKVVAQRRPDMLELLSEINVDEAKGITLDSVQFKTGEVVTITGRAQNPDDVYKYEELLNKRKNLRLAKIQSQSVNEKDKKTQFTMAVHYRTFTTKEVAKKSVGRAE